MGRIKRKLSEESALLKDRVLVITGFERVVENVELACVL
jgi:hypothetical protein